MSSDGILDPELESVRPGTPLGDWWELQRRYALHPEHLPTRRALGEPRRALAESAFAPVGSAPAESRRRWLAEHSWRAVPYGSPRYPAALAAIADPPILLWVRGRIEALEAPRVGIVGARQCTRYGEESAATLATGVAKAGVTVVSGLALGIDAAAHRGALRTGCTAAVLAHGPDALYPSAHRDLADAIAETGVLVSEFPPGLTPRKPFFPLRNRTISGLSAAVVVVEARRRSGSLATARHALAQGREVLAVPGPIDLATSEGSNQLLRDGAALALEPQDLLEAISPGWSPPVVETDRDADRAGGPPLSTGAARLIGALKERPNTLDELAESLSRDPEEVARIVVELELADLVETAADGEVRLRRG